MLPSKQDASFSHEPRTRSERPEVASYSGAILAPRLRPTQKGLLTPVLSVRNSGEATIIASSGAKHMELLSSHMQDVPRGSPHHSSINRYAAVEARGGQAGLDPHGVPGVPFQPPSSLTRQALSAF